MAVDAWALLVVPRPPGRSLCRAGAQHKPARRAQIRSHSCYVQFAVRTLPGPLETAEGHSTMTFMGVGVDTELKEGQVFACSEITVPIWQSADLRKRKFCAVVLALCFLEVQAALASVA